MSEFDGDLWVLIRGFREERIRSASQGRPEILVAETGCDSPEGGGEALTGKIVDAGEVAWIELQAVAGEFERAGSQAFHVPQRPPWTPAVNRRRGVDHVMPDEVELAPNVDWLNLGGSLDRTWRAYAEIYLEE